MRTSLLALLAAAMVTTACRDVQAPSSALDVHGSLQLATEDPFIGFAISASERHTCAFAPGDALQCWGSNTAGQIGIGSTGGLIDTPTRVDAVFEQVSVGGQHTCALDRDGVASCWGRNSFGQLGVGTTTDTDTPVRIDTELRFSDIHAAGDLTCARSFAGAVYCWGRNSSGELGVETTERCAFSFPCSRRPVAVSGGRVFTQLSVGLQNGCGLQSDGSAYCWGGNNFGALGIGTKDFSRHTAPELVHGGFSFVQISAGAAHVCGLTADGAAHCWGFNAFGALGNGTLNEALEPTDAAVGHSFTTIRASTANLIFSHTCAADATGRLFCWGGNSAKQLGVAATGQSCTLGPFTIECSPAPLAVETELVFREFDVGRELTCGISRERRAYCWGSNQFAALGNPAVETSTSTPTPVSTWMKGRPPREAAAESTPDLMAIR